MLLAGHLAAGAHRRPGADLAVDRQLGAAVDAADDAVMPNGRTDW